MNYRRTDSRPERRGALSSEVHTALICEEVLASVLVQRMRFPLIGQNERPV